jgi:hypothetical protein
VRWRCRQGHEGRPPLEHCSTPVQQVGHVVVDTPDANAEDASPATSRWCRSRDCRRRATLGVPLLLFLEPPDPLFLPFPFPLPLPLPLLPLLGVGVGGGGVGGGHNSSCCSGHGGGCCYGGCPPPEGMELNVETYPWATEWSNLISSSSRSLRMVWKEGNDYNRLMKIFVWSNLLFRHYRRLRMR